MKATWENIVHCLRDELQEYGGLLGLFEEQQGALYRRDASGVLSTVHSIEEQARVANAKRVEREQLVSEFAAEHGCLPTSTLRQLMPQFPAEIRPMMEAMIDEINRLVHRARRGARQNTLLLQRAIAMHQEALRSLRPDSYSQTYSPRGQVSVGTPQAPGSAALQAVG